MSEFYKPCAYCGAELQAMHCASEQDKERHASEIAELRKEVERLTYVHERDLAEYNRVTVALLERMTNTNALRWAIRQGKPERAIAALQSLDDFDDLVSDYEEHGTL